jgi:hypothetical protein
MTVCIAFLAGIATGGSHGHSPIGATALQERMLREDFESATSRAKLAVSETWLATGRAPTDNLLAGMHAPT